MRARAPASLTRKLRTMHMSEVDRWWQSLASADRRALQQAPGRAPARVLARFAEPGSSDESDEVTDFYEYLVSHEVYLEDGRAFHICSAHAGARAILARGLVPAGFQCPRADAACPMRVLLDMAKGLDVRLSLVREPPTTNEEGAHG